MLEQIDKFNQDLRPAMPELFVDNIPQELKDLKHWLVWGYKWNGKKWSKPPADGFTFDTANLSFDEAYKISQTKENRGIGISCHHNDLIFIDIDGVLDKDGRLKAEFTFFAPLLMGMYVEISPSGTGLRSFANVAIDQSDRRRFTYGSKGSNPLEIYNHSRYVTVTGHLWENR